MARQRPESSGAPNESPSYSSNLIDPRLARAVVTFDRITIWYGGAKPRPNDPCKWVLPEDTVFSFVYAPKKKFPLTQLNVDLSNFKREKAVEMANDFYYYNPADGLTLTTRMIEGEETFLSLERDPNQVLRDKYCKQP